MHHSFRLSPSSKGGNKVLALFKIKANVWLTVIIVVFFLLLLTGAMLRSKGAISIGRFRLASLSSEASFNGSTSWAVVSNPRCRGLNCPPVPTDSHIPSDAMFINPPANITANANGTATLNLKLSALDSNPAHQIRFEIKWGDEAYSFSPGQFTDLIYSGSQLAISHTYSGYVGDKVIQARAIDTDTKYSLNWTSINIYIYPKPPKPTAQFSIYNRGPISVDNNNNLQIKVADSLVMKVNMPANCCASPLTYTVNWGLNKSEFNQMEGDTDTWTYLAPGTWHLQVYAKDANGEVSETAVYNVMVDPLPSSSKVIR